MPDISLSFPRGISKDHGRSRKQNNKKRNRKRFRHLVVESLETRIVMASDWQNPVQPLDVDNDRNVSPLDVLVVINEINQGNLGPFETINVADGYYLDADGDGQLSPLDVLTIINHLNKSNQGSDGGNSSDPGSNPIGFIAIPLRQLSGQTTDLVTMSAQMVDGNIGFREMGIFVADSSNGRVAGLEPGQSGYVGAVLRSTGKRVLFSSHSSGRITANVEVSASSRLWLYISQDTVTHPDPYRHVRVNSTAGDGLQVRWEETASSGFSSVVGDRGFDDAVVNFSFSTPFRRNTNPVLSPIPNQIVTEETSFGIRVTAIDQESLPSQLRYSLLASPSRATIDPITGFVSWLSEEQDGPGRFMFEVRVTDPQGGSASRSFFVDVVENNKRPTLLAMDPRTIQAGEAITIQMNSSDQDLPRNTLSYSLHGNVPAGATIDNQGRITWVTYTFTPSGTYRFNVRVTDNGTPSLSSEVPITIQVTSPRVDIKEDERFITEHRIPIALNANTATLEIDFEALQFDRSSRGMIRDAFEIALVNSEGEPVGATISGGKDAFFNQTESLATLVAAGASHSVTDVGPADQGGRIVLDVAHLRDGFVGELVFRLINNDRDNNTRVRINPLIKQISGAKRLASSMAVLRPYVQIDHEVGLPINHSDWLQTTRLNNRFKVEYDFTTFNSLTNVMTTGVTLTNISSHAVPFPLWVSLNSITSSQAEWENYSGRLPFNRGNEQNSSMAPLMGQPVLNLTSAITTPANGFNNAPFIEPGNTTRFTFDLSNDSLERFEYSLDWLGRISDPPVITSSPILEIPTDELFSYQVTVISEYEGSLTYSLISGPADMVLNSETGEMTWDTATSDVGSHQITVLVTDPFGGESTQTFTIQVIEPALNRPPIWITYPLVDAFVNQEYLYPSKGTDVDHDVLEYRLVSGPNGFAIDASSGVASWIPKIEHLNRRFDVELEISDRRGGLATQSFTIQVNPNPDNRPPVIISRPQVEYDLSSIGGAGFGTVTPRLIDLDLEADEVARVPVSVVVESSIPKVDIFLLFDDTGSFASTAPQLGSLFPEVIDKVTTSLPNVDFGFGVGRFEDYNLAPFGTPVDRPFILSQPILPLSHEFFEEAISAALNRYVPGFGNDTPESLVEALFQAATGVGFDGDSNGLNTGSGVSGQIGTQVAPGITGDVPPFFRNPNRSLADESDLQSFVPFGPGTRGGAGFRDGAISIILVATDAGIGYQPDNTSHVTGFQGIRIPTENFTGASRPETPNGRGASIQQAIDALLAQHGLVVGLGTNKDINDVPRRTLEAFSIATGTINRSNAPINSNIDDDPILPGEPLYFRIACGADNDEDANDPVGEGESGVGGGGPGSGDSDGDNTCGTNANEMLVNGVSTAIEAAVRSAPILVSLQSDDSQSIFRNLSGNVLGTNQGRSEFSAEFKGDGQPHRFELQFERVGTSELLGTIPVAINDRYRYDSHAIDPDGDKVTFKLTGETHGAVIDANSGKIRWRSPAPGAYSFTLIATDEHGATDSQTWTMSIGDIRQDNHQPVIESIPDLFVMQGNTLQYDVSAQDPDIGDQLRYTISGTMADHDRIFDGLTISSNTGRILWKTSGLNVGQHQAYIRVTDGRGGVAEAPIRVTVLPLGVSLNTSPTIASEASVLGVVGETYRYRVDAFDRDFDPLEFRLLSHPQGMVIDPNTGELAWRPSIEDQGIHDVLLLVSDGRGGNASQSFSMFVQNGNLPPVFDSQPIVEIGAGSNWKYQPIASDPNGDSIEFSLLNAPENMQMGPSGLLTYSSTGQGLHHVKILADDKKGGIALQEFLLEVGDNTPPEIKSSPKPKSIKGREYRYPIDVFDADGDLVRVSLDQSSLDSGLIIVGSTLSWSPQSTGVFAIQLFATDEHGATTIQQFSLEVVEPGYGNTAPEIISQTSGPGMKDSPWTYQLIAFDLEDDPITFSLQAGPSSATITPQTGVLNWLPSNHGLFEFTVTATDSAGAQSEQKFSLTVLPNSPPRFVSTIKSKLAINQFHEQTLVAVDPNPEDSVTYSLRMVRNLSGQSDGFSIPQINRDTGLLNWLPDTSGVYELVFEARDKSGAIASKREIVLVTDPSLPNRLPTIVSSPRQLVQAERTLIHHFISIDPDHDDLTYKLLSGPDGMQLTTNGFLKWNPSINDVTKGTNPHTFTVQVDDRRGGKDIKSYFVDVTEESVNSAPVISSIPRPNAVVAKSIDYQAIATDADRDTLIWKLTAGDGTSLPVAGATIDPSSGLFRWIPSLNQIGTHHFQISVFDPFGGIDRQDFSIAVRGVNRPANIESTAPRIAVLNTEYVYDVIGFDPDFDEVSYVIAGSSPSGMALDRKTGLLTWVPKKIGSYQVQVRAVDSLGAGTTQRVFIDVYAERPNSPPVFDPVNPGFAESGRTYRKKFVAKDPDGDEVTYRLENPTPGMTVNSETGEVTWTPVASDIGSEVTINIVATDEKGKVARYNAKLPVLAPNNPPVFLSQPKVSLVAGNIYRYDMRAEDKDGDRLVFSLLTVPPQVTLDERSGQISWASKIEDAGKSFTFRVALTDDRVEQPIIQQWTVALLADNNAPTVNLLVVGNDKDNFSFDPGTSLGFEVRAHDLGRITSKRLLVNGERISLNDSGFGRFTFDEPGIYRVTAIAVDAFGNVGSKVREILVRNPNSFAPSNVLHTPIRGSVLTAPSAMRLSVTDNDDDLKTVRVFFAPLDQSTPFQLLAERLAPVGSTLSNIQDESIGIFDPTILANGEYTIRVVSTDGAFNQTISDSQVTVTGRLKLGNFTTDFVDLSLPSALIPIVIQRRYDTLNASKIGDFGYGWNLEIKTVKSRVDRETLGGPGLQGLRAFVDGTRIVITTPDGSEQGFTFRGIPDQTLFGIVLSWKAWFEPDAGNTFTLSSPANGLLKVGEEYISSSGTTFNPAHYEFGNVLDAKSIIEKLTYRINARTGLSSTVIDRNDNSITITPDGVISSVGRSILFDRDTQGRIVAITDPRGSVIRYEYDYAGNLVRVIDRMGDAVQFHYHTEPAHYLDRIVNQLGSTVVKARYTNVDFTKGASDGQNGDGEQSPVHYGQLSSIEDVNGVVTQLKFDTNKREQEIRNEDGLIAIVTLDSFGNPIKTIDRAGTQFYRTYNLPDKGLVTSETMIVGTLDKTSGEANDLTIRYSYNSFGQVTSMVDYRGNETKYTYSRTGDPRSTVSPEGISTYFQYDDKFNLTMQSSSEGTTSFITYDSKGKPTEIRSGRFNTFDGEGNGSGSGFGSGGSDEGPQGGVLKIDYNTFGEISKLTDTDGKTRSNFYDSNGNLTLSEFEWVDPENANNRKLLAINNDHNLNDQRVGARNAQSSVSFELDAMRRTSRTIDGDGFLSESLYNKSGAVVESRSQRTDQFGELKWYVSRFVYDDLGRVTHSTENALENHANSGTAGSAISYDNLGRIRKSEGRQKVVIAIEPDENNPSIYTSRLIHAGTITSVSETTFDSLGRETEIKNIFGNRTQTLYDAYGQVIESRREVFDSSGNASWLTSRVAYDSLGRILVKTSEFPTEITVPIGMALSPKVEGSSYVYDSLGRVSSVNSLIDVVIGISSNDMGVYSFLNAAGSVVGQSKKVYDDLGRLHRDVDARGQITEYEYDSRNRRTATLGHPMPSKSVGLEAEYPGLMLRTRSEVINNEYGQMTKIRSNILQIETVTGVVVSIDRSKMHEVTQRFNAEGNLVESIFPDGSSIKSEYDALGKLDSEIDQMGNRKRFGYDSSGTLSSSSLPSYTNQNNQTVTPTYEYTYDVQGLMASLIDPLGRKTEFTYSGTGLMKTRTLPSQEKETIDYDAKDRVILRVSFEGIHQRTIYDDTKIGEGRLLAREWFANATDYNQYRVEGGFNGNLPPNTKWERLSFEYDIYGRITKQIHETFLGAKNGTPVVVESRQTWTSEFNTNGLVTRVMGPIGFISYEYDPLGNKLATVGGDETGRVLLRIEYEHDDLGRLQTVSTVTRDGELLDANASLDGNQPEKTTYHYDPFGRLSYLSMPNDVIEAYEFDILGRLLSMRHYKSDSNNQTLTDNPKLSEFRYDYRPDGKRISLVERFWNQTFQSKPHQENRYDWEYDPTGRLVREILDSSDDTLDRTESFVMDATGNRMERRLDRVGTQNDRIELYSYDVNDRVLAEYEYSVSFPIVGQFVPEESDLIKSTSYDWNGTQQTEKSETTKGGRKVTHIMEYDYQGKLASVAIHQFDANSAFVGGTKELYNYDQNGSRIVTTRLEKVGTVSSEWIELSTTKYLIDSMNFTGYDQVILENQVTTDLGVSGGLPKFTRLSYVYGLDEITQSRLESDNTDGSESPNTETSTVTFVHDGHGSVRALIGTEATPVQAFVYAAYGDMLAVLNPTGILLPLTAIQTSMLYNGEAYSNATGLYNMRARWYDPSQGRFERLDPFAGSQNDPQSFHKYAFVHGDPIQGTDPTGLYVSLSGLSGFFGTLGIIGGIAGGTLGAALAISSGQDFISSLTTITTFAAAGAILAIRPDISFWIVALIAGSTGVAYGWEASQQNILPIPIAKRSQAMKAAEFATAAYRSEDRNVTGWTYEYGLENNQRYGYNGRVYTRGTFVVVAFAGTDDGPDYPVDAAQGLFGGTAQYDYAIEDAKKIVSRFPGREITFVGHSLGGGLATAAAAATGMRALTFNGAGVHSRTVARSGASLKGIDDLVDAFRVNGEFLSTLQDSMFLAGYLMPNGNGTRFNLPAQPGKNLFELHKMSFVNWGLRHVNS